MPRIGMNRKEKERAEELRKRYGGMMTFQDVMFEIGVKHHLSGEKWVADVPCTVINGRKKWRVSDVARKLERNTIYP